MQSTKEKKLDTCGMKTDKTTVINMFTNLENSKSRFDIYK